MTEEDRIYKLSGQSLFDQMFGVKWELF
jgi:hypothetical protein